VSRARALQFEWDPKKAKANFAKHHVEFESAIRAFDDPSNMVEIDDGPQAEERWRLTGFSGTRLIFVVYVEPDDGIVRIISAREATKHEQVRYYRQALPQG